MSRSYYSSSIEEFLLEPNNEILGKIVSSETHFNTTPQSTRSWEFQITHLKSVLQTYSEGHIFFEFVIPRMGKRVDVIILLKGLIFLLEYKVGSDTYDQSSITQLVDYCLDLKNFHEGSHEKLIIPILVCTEAPEKQEPLSLNEDGILEPLFSTKSNLNHVLENALDSYSQDSFDTQLWENSSYKPTPTIIEAAKILYEGHDVREISRSDAGAINLAATSDIVKDIIINSRDQRKKSICFVTGVPGSGKTLAGLNIATDNIDVVGEGKAVYLSGNAPLVEVLGEALARDVVQKGKEIGENIRKTDALRAVKKFIQNIHHFRNEYLVDESSPDEKVVVFDEAQRAWDKKHLKNWMKEKGFQDVDASEPEFLISIMDRQEDWCVIVCLVGGGQEINRGEAGLSTWIEALVDKFEDWQIFYPEQIEDDVYSWGTDMSSFLDSERTFVEPDLHLATSIRSFRSEKVSDFVNKIIEGDENSASSLAEQLDNYPIKITRNLNVAKRWLKEKARGSERYGLVADSNAIRLKAEGIFIKSDISPSNWFLDGPEDIRSSFFLEDAATEYGIQGLELDWIAVCWHAGMRWNGESWDLYKFRGTRWNVRNNDYEKKYLLNAYRVLLTRARQGMVIFIPQGNSEDPTSPPEYYDSTFNYMLRCGFENLD